MCKLQKYILTVRSEYTFVPNFTPTHSNRERERELLKREDDAIFGLRQNRMLTNHCGISGV